MPSRLRGVVVGLAQRETVAPSRLPVEQRTQPTGLVVHAVPRVARESATKLADYRKLLAVWVVAQAQAERLKSRAGLAVERLAPVGQQRLPLARDQTVTQQVAWLRWPVVPETAQVLEASGPSRVELAAVGQQATAGHAAQQVAQRQVPTGLAGQPASWVVWQLGPALAGRSRLRRGLLVERRARRELSPLTAVRQPAEQPGLSQSVEQTPDQSPLGKCRECRFKHWERQGQIKPGQGQ